MRTQRRILLASGAGAASSPYLASFSFDQGTVDHIIAEVGDDLVAAVAAKALSGGFLINDDTGRVATATYPVTWTNVGRVIIQGYVPFDSNEFTGFLSNADGSEYLKVVTGGAIRLRVGGTNYTIAPVGTIQAGVPVDLDLTFPVPFSPTAFGAAPLTGSCFNGRMDALMVMPAE
jgi:hypothetical protein